MFPGLTRADIAKLSDEQREVIARVALDQARYKRNLEKKAEGYAGYHLVPLVFIVVAVGSGAYWSGKYLPLIVLGLIGLIQFHAVGINRRIDAALKLTALLSEKQTRSQEAPEETPSGEQS